MTRAEAYKMAALRAASAQKRAAAPKPAKRAAKKDAGEVQPDGGRTPHNEAPSRTKNSSYELEVTATDRPTRKSTRKALNRQKTDSALHITQMNRASSPAFRAAARRARKS